MKSWKTTLGGALGALGLAIVAISPEFKTIGLVIAAFGQFFNGLFGRDNNVTSEEAGAKPTRVAVLVASALMLFTFSTSAAEAAKVEKATDYPRVQFQTFGVLQTDDLDRGKGGVGASVVINATDYLGFEAEGYSFGKEGILVDRGAASVRYNIVTKTKSRPYLFGGAWYNFEDQDAYGFHAGVGVAHQFAKFFTPFADVRFHKPLNGPTTAASCIARAGLSFGF